VGKAANNPAARTVTFDGLDGIAVLRHGRAAVRAYLKALAACFAVDIAQEVGLLPGDGDPGALPIAGRDSEATIDGADKAGRLKP